MTLYALRATRNFVHVLSGEISAHARYGATCTCAVPPLEPSANVGLTQGRRVSSGHTPTRCAWTVKSNVSPPSLKVPVHVALVGPP
jgi:hypothetical protein